MSVKCVRMYQSEDGKLFETVTEANKYNAQYKLLTNIKAVLHQAGYSTTDPGGVHISLLNKPELAAKLRDELNKVLEYHRNYTGKVKKKVVVKAP